MSTILLLPVHSVVHSQLATAVTERVILAYSLIATIANQPSTANLRALPIWISKAGRALLEYGAAPPRPLTDTHRAHSRTILPPCDLACLTLWSLATELASNSQEVSLLHSRGSNKWRPIGLGC